VFEVQAGTGTITTLASFNGANGVNPQAGLVLDQSGNLFGTTAGTTLAGQTLNDGTVFELLAGSGTITTLASFNGNNGEDPQAGLIEDSSGNLFGTTASGGVGYPGGSGFTGFGTVFEVAKGSGTITTLAFFNHTNGGNPYAGLLEDSSGNLFGTTVDGGEGSESAWWSGAGTVFEIQKGGSITSLVSFNSSNGAGGAEPEAGLTEDSSGNLFGTTLFGTVFELPAGTGAISTLATFNWSNGEAPEAGLVEDSSGNLFGTTAYGGVGIIGGAGGFTGYGTVFGIRSVNAPSQCW
jgi:hypothetical protein